ncbi:MAG: hypothetical protein ACNA7W_04020 [Pseudomonadales bacterium]
MVSATCVTNPKAMAAALLLLAVVSAAAPAVAGINLTATAGLDGDSLTQIAHQSETSSAATDAAGAKSDTRAEPAPGQLLSTLGSLALGIIGLLWIRRHTAEL